MFFSVDGVDGAGKSTQLREFVSWLETDWELTVVCCRDPGGTPLGEAVRELILHGREIELSSCSEMLLYMASRSQLVSEVIQPALADGKVVVSDRFLLANVVYQGYAGGLPVSAVRAVGEVATGGLEPDLTFVLDMPAERAAARIEREPDRIESRGAEFMNRVRAGFLAEAADCPDRIRVVDADRAAGEIQEEIRAAARPLLLGQFK